MVSFVSAEDKLMRKTFETRTYERSKCVVFKKTNEQFGGLSNMAPGSPLVVNDVRIRTSEALYQACRFPHMPEVQRLIINQRSPMTAKMRSKRYRKHSRSDWNTVRVTLMRWCLRVKLAQNWQSFSSLLLATGDRPIVEDSRKDDFWGAKPISNEKLVGINVLGRLLMELREELRSSDVRRLSRIDLPNIPEFLLYSKPIGVVEACGEAAAARVKGPELLGVPLTMTTHDLGTPTMQSGSYGQASGQEQNAGGAEPKSDEGIRTRSVIPKECKRLAEVDFPIAVVSKHAAREKSIRHGHPSTLHLWWARRPLASCRAMLLALLIPDPCDEYCPEDFKEKARALLPRVQGTVGPKDENLRKALLKFIGDFANWDLSSDRTYLGVSRALVKAAHLEETPLVVDPFAGGGSIPLEALRLGCETFASDLNPVACLILKVLLEHIPRHGPELAEELRKVGAEIEAAAEKELAKFYPPDPDGSKPIAYLWARTVCCEQPNCGAEIPLMRSFWLCKKASRKRALTYKVDQPGGKPPQIVFEIFEPKSDRDVPTGTVTRAKATCPCCNMVLSPERVLFQLAGLQGGADVIFDEKGNRAGGATLLAVVTLKRGEEGRCYRLPTQLDYECIWKATKGLEKAASKPLTNGLSPVPEEPLPPVGTLGFRVQRYGMLKWGDLFTARQKLVLISYLSAIRSAYCAVHLKEILVLSLGHIVTRNSSLCIWRYQADQEKVESVFGRQALPMVWDFAEAIPTSGSTGSFEDSLEIITRVLQLAGSVVNSAGQVHLADARESPLPDEVCNTWFIDPPYYDAIPYSDLSDFFFVWLKRSLLPQSLLRDPFDPQNPLTPKVREIVQDNTKQVEGLVKDRVFFERMMAEAFAEGRRVLKDNGIGCVVFAHKTTEGWEALLSGLIDSDWVITGSWPIATELRNRLRAQDSAALTTSVHLVFRPRPGDASVGDWGDVLRELPQRVGDWMERLQREGIRGADLVFACIGPALEIFSRYTKVETAEGRVVKLPEYLEKVWEVVGRTALEQVLGTAETQARNSAAGALEEDARLTALFLWTLQSTNSEQAESSKGQTVENESEEEADDEEEETTSKKKKKGFSLIFDVVRRFAQPLGIHLPDWESRIIETEKGIIRLLSVAERAKQLFGEEGADAVADTLERRPESASQLQLFPQRELGAAPQIKGRGRGKRAGAKVSDEALRARREATTLDRIHAAMLLQAGGKANALRALLKAEQNRGPDFLRLANALTALYPRGSEEKRLLDAMLLAVPR